MNPKVSIVTPCYNNERWLPNFLDSILSQTYDNIQLILVNDGSSDQSEIIIESYMKKMNDAGYEVIYHYQENMGLGAAIQSGIKLMDGDYFIWPDSDDFLHPESITKRVIFLEDNQEYAVVTSDAYKVHEEDLKVVTGFISDWYTTNEETDQFELLIKGHSIFCPGCHMVRMSMFFDVNPERYIYAARHGQNWQILLPLYYKYPRAFLNEPLYYYVIHEGSMSNRQMGLNDRLEKMDEHEAIILNTLSKIDIPDHEYKELTRSVVLMYCRRKLRIASDFKSKDLTLEFAKQLESLNGMTIQDRVQYLRVKSPFIEIIYKIYRVLQYKLRH